MIRREGAKKGGWGRGYVLTWHESMLWVMRRTMVACERCVWGVHWNAMQRHPTSQKSGIKTTCSTDKKVCIRVAQGDQGRELSAGLARPFPLHPSIMSLFAGTSFLSSANDKPEPPAPPPPVPVPHVEPEPIARGTSSILPLRLRLLIIPFRGTRGAKERRCTREETHDGDRPGRVVCRAQVCPGRIEKG